jgi:hypothetical protein
VRPHHLLRGPSIKKGPIYITRSSGETDENHVNLVTVASNPILFFLSQV